MKSFNKTFFESESVSKLNGFCILKPEFLNHEEDFLKMLSNNGWKVVQKDKRKLTQQEAQELYKMHKNKDFYNDLCKYMSSSECLCCSCYKDCKDPIKEIDSLINMGYKPKDAIKEVASMLNLNKQELYKQYIDIKNSR
jgi:nucleoside diphosphate kinase